MSLSFDHFERHLLACRNPRKPAACLLILWVGAAGGPLSREQWETARKTIGSQAADLELCRALAEGGDQRSLQLSCEVIREAPPWAQLAVLTMAIRIATAHDELAVEANLALRFLGTAFDERHDLEELFPMETGHPFPNLPGDDDWWSARDEEEDGDSASALPILLNLLGQLREELSLAAGDWWSEKLEAQFGGGDVRGPLLPRLARRRGGKRIRRRVIRVVVPAVLLIALAWIVVARSSHLQYQLAHKRDTVESYRKFLERFPDSGSAAKARPRFEQLLDREMWADAVAKESVEAYRAYLRRHPRGEHRSEAETRLMRVVSGEIDLAYNQWNMRSLEEVAARNSGIEIVQKHAAAAMQGLRDDPGWVVLSGSLDDCRNYLEQNPETPKREALEKRIVALEIVEIRTRPHLPLNELNQVDPGEGEATSEIEIRNWTAGPLTIRYGGPASYRFVVEKARTQTVEIKNGSYSVAVSGAGEAAPQFGTQDLRGGKHTFYFSRRPPRPANDLRAPTR